MKFFVYFKEVINNEQGSLVELMVAIDGCGSAVQ